MLGKKGNLSSPLFSCCATFSNAEHNISCLSAKQQNTTIEHPSWSNLAPTKEATIRWPWVCLTVKGASLQLNHDTFFGTKSSCIHTHTRVCVRIDLFISNILNCTFICRASTMDTCKQMHLKIYHFRLLRSTCFYSKNLDLGVYNFWTILNRFSFVTICLYFMWIAMLPVTN